MQIQQQQQNTLRFEFWSKISWVLFIQTKDQTKPLQHLIRIEPVNPKLSL